MHHKTARVTESVAQMETPETRLAILRNHYRGETAYIVSCGPSIEDVLTEDRLHMLDKSLVFSVKQAYDLIPWAVDFHLLTGANLKKYSYHHDTLVFRTTLSKSSTSGLYTYLKVANTDKPVNLHRHYGDYEFSKRLNRPKGPGVMNEIALYLALHLGCSRIVAIGWDLNSDELRHYYDDCVPKVERYRLENKWAQKSVPAMLQWLESHGVELRLCSPRSALDIPQIPIEALGKF